MPITFGGLEPEPENNEQAKPITPTPNKYNAENPHPDKGVYMQIPLTTVTLDSKQYFTIANTGQCGITNVRFDFPMDLGDGKEITVTYHAGWGNLTIVRSAEYQKAHKLLGTKSGLHCTELFGYEISDNGVSNITDLLGPMKPKQG